MSACTYRDLYSTCSSPAVYHVQFSLGWSEGHFCQQHYDAMNVSKDKHVKHIEVEEGA